MITEAQSENITKMQQHISAPRLWHPAMAAPLAFMIMFMICIYGVLLVGHIGIARFLIHKFQLAFFINQDKSGVALMVLCMELFWIASGLILAAFPYSVLRWLGKKKQAVTTAAIVLYAVFSIFLMPFILWPMVRNASPRLRLRRRAKLKRMVTDRKRRNPASRAIFNPSK